MLRSSFLLFFIIFNIILFNATAQQSSVTAAWQQVYADKHTSSTDTTTIKGKKYLGYLNGNTYFLLNAKGDTLIHKQSDYFDTDFADFNRDGFKDILLYHPAGTGTLLDLFLFVPATQQFKEVAGFSDYPSATAVSGSKYYYSYRKSGCADMNWDSDLFTIENFKVQRKGNIAGRECNNRSNQKDGIYISRVRDNVLSVVQSLPLNTIWTYKDARWGFIKSYWNEHYKFFP